VLCRRNKVILLDHRQTAAEKRCSLAHAVAHLDLGHAETPAGFFEMRQEREADQLAARRLVPVKQLARVLAWTVYRSEVAAELGVDLATLAVRERHLHPSEKAYLWRHVRRLGETA
jgi:Zn-dependent peptidase ImmA (M78 family)